MATPIPMTITTGGELTVATLCTPVTGATFQRPQSVRFDESIRPFSRQFSSATAELVEEDSEGSEGSDSQDDPLEAWVRYGFIERGLSGRRRKDKARKGNGENNGDSSPLPQGEGRSASQERRPNNSEAEAATATTVRNTGSNTGGPLGWLNSGSATDTGTALLSSSTASTVRFVSQHAPHSPANGATTPPTAVVTPSSMERSITTHAHTAAGQAIIRRARASLPGPPRDSLAAAIVAASTSAASRAAAVAERVRVEEMERHKRNRTERLWPYGCSRTLYPRICPTTESDHPIPLEVETERWIRTLRGTAPAQGASSTMACMRQTFRKERLTSLRSGQQPLARASLAADVSGMEGPDGLLHSAVTKGDHPLAARAVQFLVDKEGANVNSRDEWGRTPLHVACGMGVVSLARFFIRRGANVDALDIDKRPPIFFACAGGHTTTARYLTRMEVGAKVNLRDVLGQLPGEFFCDNVSQATQEEIAAILVAAGWPDLCPRDGQRSRGRSLTRRRGERSRTSRSRSQQHRQLSPRRSSSLIASEDGESLPPESVEGRGSGRTGEGGESGQVAESRGSGRLGESRRSGHMRGGGSMGSGRVGEAWGSGCVGDGRGSGRVGMKRVASEMRAFLSKR